MELKQIIISKTRFHYNMRLLKICILLIYVIPFAVLSQNEGRQYISVLVRPSEDKVRLRWAPNSPSAWLKLNKYGYQIERFTVKKNGQLLPPGHDKVTLELVLPKPVDQWEQIVNENDYAAVLAQALYGESFQVEGTDQGGLAQIINKSKEVEQRFSFALYAADMNFEAAKMAALGYEDVNVEKGNEYLYRIISLVPEDLLKIETGLGTAKTSEIESLPEPLDVFAVPEDKSVMITWEYEMFKSVFTSYHLEKSDNGSSFKRVSDLPLVNLNDKPNAPAKRMFYIDTLAQNNKTYYYRVIGISPFGEESPPSKVVATQGFKKLSAVPHISKHNFEKSGRLVLEWDFKKEAENEITGFELNWAPQEKGPYKIVKTNIPPNVRKTTYQEFEPSNYFRVIAIGKNNQKTSSLAAFVQTIDSIPPSAPIGVTGVVDSLGVVKLNWEANKERDMLGYRVFRGNIDKEELSQITVSPIRKNSFTDTVQVKSLNDKVFYQIVAVDRRFNMSDYSQKLALRKPDIVPPSSPVFLEYKVSPKGVYLQWINSTSSDVDNHQLYRQKMNESEKGWQLVFKTDTVTNYVDEKIMPGTKYRYAIFAEDESGLKSAPSTPISVTSQNNETAEVIRGFNGFSDRTNKQILLSWRRMPKDISEIVIYKAKKEGKPVIWRQIPPNITKLTDESISPGNIYVYSLKTLSKNGASNSIKTIEINY